ncbi:MAG TPA: gamma-glutamyl-gamma-aminobutyrate hydrolase family protein [Bacteroidota bacterium]|nr:gamma-glutamyl-gamma-aminobutyrate hydrolase family protein [Bacteroidota bacterium]
MFIAEGRFTSIWHRAVFRGTMMLREKAGGIPCSLSRIQCSHRSAAMSGARSITHHQGVDRVGKGLAVNARSEDGVVEGLEWDDRSTAAFLILVQWHPERMKDLSNPFTDKIGRAFLEDVSKCKQYS